MSYPDLELLAKRLAAGESPSSLLQTVGGGDDDAELLKRCAAVHEFDDELLELLRTLEPVVQGVELDEVLKNGSIEPVPGRDGAYRVPAGQRQRRYDGWWVKEPQAVVPDALRTLSARVLDHYERRDGAFVVEGLYHELIVRADEGLRTFEKLYGAADAAFDLGRCEDLVDVLTERLALLGPEAAQLCNRYRARLRSRSMWMADWYATARFLPPGGSEAAISSLLEGDRGRVLALWSTGGMGKSSHLRWMIARHCVPNGDACARIDFDHIDPLLATREPWTLLVEAATQLDQQLPEAPFNEFLAQYAGHRERLSGIPGPVPAAVDEVLDRFIAVLRELPADRRIVLALDTLEEALLLGGPGRDQKDLGPLLRQLATVVQQAPALRLVLACRYQLSQRIGEFATLFPDAAELQLQPFTDEEARVYLTDRRGIERPEIVDSIARSADGVPLKLELLADVAEERPDLDPAEIEHYAQADLRYVMDRIVSRLEPDLQLLLRYGVAPRVLERNFVREVLGPLLDDPEGQRVDVLWAQLTRYAGTASWVMLEPGDIDAVRFHQAVLEPMRDLLREGGERLHDGAELQRRASDWFMGRADADPTRATRWMCEAVFHRFQYEGPAAEGFWLELIRDARREQRPDRRRALAAEVLRDDYSPRGEDQDVIRPATRLRARWELAVAAVQLAHADTPERREAEWLEAERALADLHHLLASVAQSPLRDSEMALLEAGIRLGRRDLEAAKPYISRALRGPLASEDRMWLHVAHAECAANEGLGSSALYFRNALRLAEHGVRPATDRATVLLLMARHEAERDRFDRAVSACEQASPEAAERLTFELRLVRAELDLRTGAPSSALNRLEIADADEPELDARRNILRIRALLAAARPFEALKLAQDTGARFSETLQLGGARQQAVAAEGRELRGKVQAMLLDTDDAIKDFDEAAARWSRLGSSEAVCRCWVRIAEMHLRGARDVNQAEVRLDQARRTSTKPGEDAWTRRTLLGAEVLAAKGRESRAEALIDDVIAALQRRRRPPRALIDAAQRGLAVGGESSQQRYLQLLCDQLAEVTPPAARLALLKPLERCPVLTAPSALRRRLRRLVPSPEAFAGVYANLAPYDLALLSLVDADVERVARHADTARRTVGSAADRLGDLAPAAARPELLRAAIRVGDRELTARLAEALTGESGPARVLEASMLLRAAEALGPGEERARLIGAAWPILDGAGAAAGGWTALLLDLEGQEARRAGDDERGRVESGRAAALYEALGDVHRARKLSATEDVPAPAPPGGEYALVGENEARVTVRLRADELTVSVRRLHHARSVIRLAEEPPLVRALVEAPHEIVGRAAAPPVVRRVRDDLAVLGEELKWLLASALGVDAAAPPGEPALSAGLRSKDTLIHALPWELAAPGLERAGVELFRRAPRARGAPADIRAVQTALTRTGSSLASDGILGERTRAALRAFQADHELPVTGSPDARTVQHLHAQVTGGTAPWVAVVQPAQRIDELAFRGSRHSGVPVAWRYERAGFRVMALDSPTADELKTALERRPVAILHLNLGLVDHHGTAAVDLLPPPAAKARAPSTGRLTGAALDGLIPSDLPSPLVILDATAPRTPRETATQLLLRNAFAGELMAVGTVRAALATGLGHYGDQERLYDALIGVLGRGGEMRELVQVVHGLGGDDPATSEAFMFSLTALFARTPDVRFPAPWT